MNHMQSFMTEKLIGLVFKILLRKKCKINIILDKLRVGTSGDILRN